MDILETLTELGGYWGYNGGRYLAKLTSGKVSDTFVNTGVLTCRPKPLANAVESVLHTQVGSEDIDTFAVRYFDVPNLYVCGPAMGGITLAYEVARQLGGTAIWFDDAGKPSQPIPKDATVLLVTDRIEHGNRHILTEEFADYVAQHLGELRQILPYILCLVDTSCADIVEVKVKHAVMPERKAALPLIQGKMLHIIPLARLSVLEWDSVKAASEDIGCHTCRKCVGNPDETCDAPIDMLEAVPVKELIAGLSDAEFCDKAGGL